jgi:hypothetical protein
MKSCQEFIAKALGAQDGPGISSYAAGIAIGCRAIHISVESMQLIGYERGQCGRI